MTYSDILGSLNLQDTPEPLTQETTNVLPEPTLQPFERYNRPRNHNAIAIAWELQDTISGGIADVDGIILGRQFPPMFVQEINALRMKRPPGSLTNS